jgi:2-hydroxy-3-oxopropionate reductase
MPIGFIGLGVMGLPMSLNLLKAGHEVIGYNRSPEKLRLFAAAGGTAAGSTAEVAKAAPIIITMLPDSPDVRKVALGPGGILENAVQGSLLVDMSSIDPLVAAEIGRKLSEKGISMIDAPVSGGEPKAVEGTLSIMAGGDEADLERARPILSKMGSSIVRIGGLGSGNVAKLANQIVVAANIAAVGEALALAAKAGADPGLVFEAVRGGLAGSAVMEAKAPMMLKGDRKPGFRIELHLKDIGNVLSAGRALSAPLPLSELARAILSELAAEGFGASDHSAMVRYFEKRAGVSVSNGNQAGRDRPGL